MITRANLLCRDPIEKQVTFLYTLMEVQLLKFVQTMSKSLSSKMRFMVYYEYISTYYHFLCEPKDQIGMA